MKVLAIDIGGTKSAMGLCALTAVGSRVTVSDVSCELTLASRDYRSLTDMVRAWQSEHREVSFDAMGAGVAGPVVSGRVHLTNLGWDIDAGAIATTFKKPFRLCNDMQSHGWGLLGLGTDQIEILNAGTPGAGAKALIAAGTGLGEAIVGWDGTHHAPMPGEGGHSSFSPTNELEDDLLRFLRGELSGHVSWERVLGGFDGFRNIARFLAHRSHNPLPAYLAALSATPSDWGAAIAGADDAFSREVLTVYATLYGREAANLALKCVPSGGVYLGGGIAPRILPWLRRHFMTGFTDKGRFGPLLSSIPVYVIKDTLNGLKGAAMQFSRDL